MAEQQHSSARYGVIVGDSLLNHYFEQNEQLLDDYKQHFGLDVIQTKFQGGATIRELSHKQFPQIMAEINNINKGEGYTVEVFVIAGAVDISNAISYDYDFDECGFINKRNNDLLSFCEYDSVHRVNVFPLTMRKVCQNKDTRFPKYLDKQWIDTCNICICKANEYKCD